MFKRLVCFFLGHKPFPSRKYNLEEVKANPSPTIGSPLSLAKVNKVALNNSYGNLGSLSNILNINAGPLEVKLKVCSRCKCGYWTTDLLKSWVVDANNVPELKEYLDYQERMAWEEEQRKVNPSAEKAWKSYQMLLKLGKKSSHEAEPS